MEVLSQNLLYSFRLSTCLSSLSTLRASIYQCILFMSLTLSVSAASLLVNYLTLRSQVAIMIYFRFSSFSMPSILVMQMLLMFLNSLLNVFQLQIRFQSVSAFVFILCCSYAMVVLSSSFSRVSLLTQSMSLIFEFRYSQALFFQQTQCSSCLLLALGLRSLMPVKSSSTFLPGDFGLGLFFTGLRKPYLRLLLLLPLRSTVSRLSQSLSASICMIWTSLWISLSSFLHSRGSILVYLSDFSTDLSSLLFMESMALSRRLWPPFLENAGERGAKLGQMGDELRRRVSLFEMGEFLAVGLGSMDIFYQQSTGCGSKLIPYIPSTSSRSLKHQMLHLLIMAIDRKEIHKIYPSVIYQQYRTNRHQLINTRIFSFSRMARISQKGYFEYFLDCFNFIMQKVLIKATRCRLILVVGRYVIFKRFLMPLTQERAEARGLVIKRGSIFYDFHVALKSENYSGFSEISFELLSIPAELPVDFSGKATGVVINGHKAEVKAEEGFLFLDVSQLRVGHNTVGVHYTNSYNNDGSGCVSFVDVDKKQYIYTQFEPYYANRVFACFDQPDLKAKMRLYVISPSSWKKVLSNEYAVVEDTLDAYKYYWHAHTHFQGEVKTFLEGKEGRMTIFPETKLLPTYLFCYVAGEYLELKLEEERTYNGIPMSLYCIESLYTYMQELAPFIFEITIQSMRFFESFFGYKYAFNKYDQIFAHEYKWGAMENAGIVTFNDLYIFKEKVSTERKLALANTISHELAHHWFGNLVTMKWWDDLWLNESFADFISHFCLEKIKGNVHTLKYESSMASFLQRKGWGYHEDMMITTHPIRGPVANTSVADSIFDGITYSKGAATMKQLLFLMSQGNFSKALGEYFHQYEWNNATIDNFLEYMQKHFDINDFKLTEWREMWLEKASLNVIEASWNPEDTSPQAKITIHQTPYTHEHPTLRLHKIKVAFFTENFQADVIEVLVRPQAETVAHYDGSKHYKAILLNFQDHTFAKNTIDKVSLDFFIKNINSISDILSRTLIWRSFFEMIKDAKMTSHEFVKVITSALAEESSDSIFERQFDFVHTAINHYTPQNKREELNSTMFKYIYDLIPKVHPDQQNRIVILKSKLVNFAYTDEEKEILLRWMRDEEPNLKAHPMTVGQRWSTVVKAFTLPKLSLEEKEAIFEAQKALDPSDTAKNKRFTCDALKATEEEFEKIYESFKDPESKYSIAVKNSIASGWNHEYHAERLAKYRDRYFEDIGKLAEVLAGDHFEVFYESFQPIDDDLLSHIERYSKISFPAGKDKHTRDILKIIDNLKRRQRAYELYATCQAAL